MILNTSTGWTNSITLLWFTLTFFSLSGVKMHFKKNHLYILCNNYFLKKILYSKILLFISLYCVKLSADHHLLLKIDHYYWNFVLLEHLRTIMSLFLGCSNGSMPFYQAFIFFFILCLISNKYFIKKKSLRPLERCSNFKFETNAGFFN